MARTIRGEASASLRAHYRGRSDHGREVSAPGRADGFVRETFRLERIAARAKARDWLERWPRAAYWSEVESWRALPGSGGDGELIEFTMRRLPTAD